MTPDARFVRLLENSLGVSILSCTVTFSAKTRTLLESGETGDYLLEVKGENFSCTITGRGGINEEKARLVVTDALNLYGDLFREHIPSECARRAEILGSIVSGESIDSVLNELVQMIISSPLFDSAGVFLLNEILLEVRGLVYAGDCGGKAGEGIRFRSRKIRLTKKSPLSDVMYFGRCERLNLDEIDDWRGMQDCLKGEAYASPLINMDGTAAGIVIATGSGGYSEEAAAILQFYSNLCSIAISNANMRGELIRLKTYEEDFEKVDYVSKDLVKMGMLAATVAHELKNPLVAIGGFAKRLAAFGSDSRMDNYIAMIQSEVTRLENLVTEILDYSKSVDLKIEKIHLDSVVNETLRLLSENISIGMIHVSKSVDPEITVYADKNRFIQVLINVIINAIQVMPSGGDLKISAEESSETIILYIKDTGGGVPDCEMEKIFEPFHSSKQDGTGLGLSLSKKIMTAHGGQITVTNDSIGAVFSLILPKTGGFDD
ncbi:MAG: ATP-binding protein [Geovibrio sp.]|nr:ATP-binding protein [Geovibrio sp.]